MKIRTAILAAAALAFAAVPVLAHEMHDDHAPAKGAVTVQGEILDMACYVSHDGHGPDHAGCAAKCLKQGQPMGLLAKDGEVYLLLGDHGDIAPYEKAKTLAGKNVEISGEASAKGDTHAITVKSVKPL